MHFYGLISKLMVLLIKEEMYRSNVQPRKKFLLREVYLLARCLMLNLSRRHVLISIYATRTWNLCVFFLQFLEYFRWKIYKNVLQEMRNGLSLRQQQLQVIMYYKYTWAFHKLTCWQNKCTPKKRTILRSVLYYYNTLKRYRDFS